MGSNARQPRAPNGPGAGLRRLTISGYCFSVSKILPLVNVSCLNLALMSLNTPAWTVSFSSSRSFSAL